ncbi:hypothetical protein GBA52_016286 [Prunus armeniaca]|nr:hypothetical protein GBA52_016286 [Prunus armeniaca]
MDGECLGRFLNIRVSVDVSTPLRRGKKMMLPSGNTVFVEFRYERLSEFCFCCGRVGHVFKECSFVDPTAKHASDKPYGIWLRATKDFYLFRAGNPKRTSGSGVRKTQGLMEDEGSEEGDWVKEREMEEGGQTGNSSVDKVAESVWVCWVDNHRGRRTGRR